MLREIRRVEACAPEREPVPDSDEIDLHLNPKLGRDWMLLGQQRRVVTPNTAPPADGRDRPQAWTQIDDTRNNDRRYRLDFSPGARGAGH